ncbi:MAG: arginase family protein, partial [Candidatus Xenobia bacterium]
MDLGASRRGVDMGPYSVRVAGIDKKLQGLGYAVFDEGNVLVDVCEKLTEGDPKRRFQKPIAQVCNDLSARVKAAADAGHITVTIGGDHSIAIGSLAGVAASYKARGGDIGLIWFDAHADFHTPDTTISGNIHGMPLAVVMGFGDPELTAIGGLNPKFRADKVVHIGG